MHCVPELPTAAVATHHATATRSMVAVCASEK